jgi:hypothetical protein
MGLVAIAAADFSPAFIIAADTIRTTLLLDDASDSWRRRFIRDLLAEEIVPPKARESFIHHFDLKAAACGRALESAGRIERHLVRVAGERRSDASTTIFSLSASLGAGSADVSGAVSKNIAPWP